MKKKSQIIVQKYMENLAKTQKNINLNDLDEDIEEAREELDGDQSNNIADLIEVQEEDEQK